MSQSESDAPDFDEAELTLARRYVSARWLYLQALFDYHGIGRCDDWRREVDALADDFARSLRTLGL